MRYLRRDFVSSGWKLRIVIAVVMFVIGYPTIIIFGRGIVQIVFIISVLIIPLIFLILKRPRIVINNSGLYYYGLFSKKVLPKNNSIILRIFGLHLHGHDRDWISLSFNDIHTEKQLLRILLTPFWNRVDLAELPQAITSFSLRFKIDESFYQWIIGKSKFKSVKKEDVTLVEKITLFWIGPPEAAAP